MMYQNLDGTQKKSKTLLIIIVTLVIVIAIVGATSVIFKNQQNDNKEPNEYKEENNSHLNSNEEEKETEEEKEPVEETPTEEPPVEEPKKPNEYSNIEELTLYSFKEMIKKKRSFVVVISQTYCAHCIGYKPMYNEVLKEHNSKGYELDIYGLSQTNRTELLNTYKIKGTPTTLLFIDGVLQKERIEGIVEKTYLVDFLTKYGFV